MIRRSFSALLLMALVASLPARASDDDLGLDTEPKPLIAEEDLPKRHGPLIELGPDFFGPGKLSPGWELPTGAVWYPSLWSFGELRAGVNYLDSDTADEPTVELATRLDLHTNLQLSGTERILFTIHPLHRGGTFSSYTFQGPGLEEGWDGVHDFEIKNLFFAGDLGEIFPRADPLDQRGLDLQFAVGRQQLMYQDGIMFNDSIDSIGIVRNNVNFPGVPNSRVALIYGWGNLHRGNNLEDKRADMVGLFTETDTRYSTIEADFAWVLSDPSDGGGGDGFYWAVASSQRIGFTSSTIRVLGSMALDEPSAAVDDGVLVFTEFARELPRSHNFLYLSGFYAVDNYTSAARAPTNGGPIGKTGLLFASVGLGRWTPALGNRPNDSWGYAVGSQFFFNRNISNLVIEVGQHAFDSGDDYGVGFRYQHKLGTRYMLQLDGYVTDAETRADRVALRTELQVKF